MQFRFQSSLFLIIALFFFIFAFLTCTPNQNEYPIVLTEFIYNEAPFPSCHASTVVETPEGIAAAWFGGTHEQHIDVEIWFSRKINGQWSEPVSIADGVVNGNERYPTWNPVLFQIPDGDLILYYKVGPSPREWWGMQKTSSDNGRTWSEAIRLPDDILGPIKNKPVLLDNGVLISPSSTEYNGWDVHLEVSYDLGKTWKIVGPVNDPDEFNAIQPSILTYDDGKLQILCRSQADKVVAAWSVDNGKTWSQLTATDLPNPNSGTDAVTLHSGLQLIVYNPTIRDEGQWGGSRTPLSVAVSKDGENWKEVLTLEDQPGEYSYPAVIQSEDGLVHITYTWKRETIKYVVLDPSAITLND
jgi:predicted neuraminidase